MLKTKKQLLHWLTRFEKTSKEKGMAGFLIKRGLAKSKAMANFELLIVAAVFFSLSPLVFYFI